MGLVTAAVLLITCERKGPARLLQPRSGAARPPGLSVFLPGPPGPPGPPGRPAAEALVRFPSLSPDCETRPDWPRAGQSDASSRRCARPIIMLVNW